MIRWLLALLLIFGALKIPKNYFRWTGGFRWSKCELNLPNFPSWQSPLPNDQTLQILSQPFIYLKRGSQSYVFTSQDGNYVLKIFAQPLLRRNMLERMNRPFPRPDLNRIREGLEGYRIASELPPSSTGIVYLHLNTTADLLPRAQFRDALGRTHLVSLDKARFVLQRKSAPLSIELKKLAQANRSEEIERLIDSYKEAIALRTSLSIKNWDTDFKHNFGILDGKVIEFDFGEFKIEPTLDPSKELWTFLDRLRYWMGEFAPEYESAVQARMDDSTYR
ncbi:MAG: hypothetical protein JSS32_10685 [Verrucomicrobia bacterium]|nr:hypothetical protein [Verrucomicrobiota bacterium]